MKQDSINEKGAGILAIPLSFQGTRISWSLSLKLIYGSKFHRMKMTNLHNFSANI